MKTFLFSAVLLLTLSCKEKELPAVSNGDVSIAYTFSGKGDTTILLVHGWCINKEYWRQTIHELTNQYTVVAMDLGGHGHSGHNRTSWTVEDYARDVAALITTLNLQKVILVGHSMGGDIILQAALSMPDKIIGFIAVDTFKGFTTKFSAEEEQQISAFIRALKTNFDSTATVYSKLALFPANYGDTASVNRVIRNIQEADPEIAIQSLESVIQFTPKEVELLPALTIPVQLIVSDYTPTQEEKLKTYCRAGYSLRTIRGTGHYPMIEKPEEFARLLKEAIQSINRGQ